MKTMKLALLGGAALAVSAAGAQADDLADLKAQIESLNARVAQMEAAPAVPAGYSLLTISEGSQPVIPGLEVLRKDALATGDKATVIGVLPTADAPATTEITWSGYARAGLVYVNYGDANYRYEYFDEDLGEDVAVRGTWAEGDDDVDVYARGQIKVTGKTDTAVGEVGATVEFRGNFDGARRINAEQAGGSTSLLFNGGVYIEQAWGWWAMTPELTLGGGFAGSLGNIGYGYDGACNCYYTDNADVGMNPGDTSQMRLSWGSGPFTMAIALEDATGAGVSASGNPFAFDDSLGGAGEIKYSGDTFNGEISGFWRDGADEGGFDNEDTYGVGAGVGFALGDFASISAGAMMGQYNDGEDFWRASILGSVNLGDTVHAELAFGYTDNTYGATDEVYAVLAGIYYDPVSQLTIGLEGEWYEYGDFKAGFDHDGDPTTDLVRGSVEGSGTFQVDLVTVFRF